MTAIVRGQYREHSPVVSVTVTSVSTGVTASWPQCPHNAALQLECYISPGVVHCALSSPVAGSIGEMGEWHPLANI